MRRKNLSIVGLAICMLLCVLGLGNVTLGQEIVGAATPVAELAAPIAIPVPVATPVPEAPQKTIEMWTRPTGCPPCHRWINSELPEAIKLGYHVTIHPTTEGTTPRFKVNGKERVGFFRVRDVMAGQPKSTGSSAPVLACPCNPTCSCGPACPCLNGGVCDCCGSNPVVVQSVPSTGHVYQQVIYSDGCPCGQFPNCPCGVGQQFSGGHLTYSHGISRPQPVRRILQRVFR